MAVKLRRHYEHIDSLKTYSHPHESFLTISILFKGAFSLTNYLLFRFGGHERMPNYCLCVFNFINWLVNVMYAVHPNTQTHVDMWLEI